MAAGDRTMLAKLAAEAVGTFTLVFAGMLVLTLHVDNIVAAALTHGLAIGVMASATMTISGGQLNPAVTLAVWAARRMPGSEALAYVLAQLAGAAAGALAAGYCIPAGMTLGGIPALGANVPLATGILVEAILTFFLVFVIFGTAVDARFGARLGGLAIGLAVALDIFAGGALTGAAMNPARWFGPALVMRDWGNAVVWILGPLLGAVAASALWTGLLLPKAAPRTPTEPSP